MLSWQAQYQLVQSLLSDPDSTNLTMIKELIHTGERALETALNIYYTTTTRTITTYTDAITGSSYQAYRLPENFLRMDQMYVTSGTTRYIGTQIHDEGLWQQMNLSPVTGNYLQFYFIRGRSVLELYPIPSSALTATLIYQASTKPLLADDYVTGGILTLTNATAAVVGTGTTWTAEMVGRFLQVTANGQWYKILTFGTATTLTLENQYQGTSIAAGNEAYTIGEFPVTPPDTHILPVYYACWKMSLFRKDVQMAREWERQWKEGIASAQSDYANNNASNIIENKPMELRGIINPNYFPSGMT